MVGEGSACGATRWNWACKSREIRSAKVLTWPGIWAMAIWKLNWAAVRNSLRMRDMITGTREDCLYQISTTALLSVWKRTLFWDHALPQILAATTMGKSSIHVMWMALLSFISWGQGMKNQLPPKYAPAPTEAAASVKSSRLSAEDQAVSIKRAVPFHSGRK